MNQIWKMPHLTLATVHKMNPVSVFQLVRASAIQKPFFNNYWDLAKSKMKVTLIIYERRLFLANPGTVRKTVEELKEMDLDFKPIFGECILGLESLQSVGQLINSPVYSGIEFEGITTIDADEDFVDGISETLRRLNFASERRVSVHRQKGAVSRRMIFTVRPTSVEVDIESEAFSPMFIHHPAFLVVTHLVYAPYVKSIAVPPRYKDVKILNCGTLNPVSIRENYILKWQRREPVYFRRVWGCTEPIAKECRQIFKGVTRKWLWSVPKHEDSFLYNTNMTARDLKDLKAVSVISHEKSDTDITLVVQTTHRLLLQSMPYVELQSVLDELKKNPTLRDPKIPLGNEVAN